MASSSSSKLVPYIVAAVAAAAVVVWIATRPRIDLYARLPEPEVPISTTSREEPTTPKAEARLLKLEGVPADIPGAWPCFRGENRDNVAVGEKGLARQWPEGGPKVLWTIDLGEGYAGPAVRAGRVYVLDYDRQILADALRCFSLSDGKEVWRYEYPVAVKRNHGMSRTVPAVTEAHVVSLGPKCHVTCCDAPTGELRWQLNLVKDFGAKVPPWYAGQCPLIEGDRVILATGGPSLLIAVEVATGKLIWKSSNPRGWLMTHSSVVPIQMGSKRMYVYCGGGNEAGATGGVAGVSAADGAILWETDAWTIKSATVPSPLYLGGGRIYLSGGYEAGSLLLEIVEKDGSLIPVPKGRFSYDVFGSTQQTPILYDNHIFGVRPPDGQLVCLDLDGKEVWAADPSHKYGIGPYMIADGLILLMDDLGVLSLVEAKPQGYRRLAQAKVFENGHDAWAPMALVSGRLLLRDFTRLKCLDLRGG